MSQDKDTKLILLGALAVGAFLYSRRNVAPMAYQPARPGGVATMPGSAGTGWQQVGAAALTGFLKAAASGIQNGANSYVPSLYNEQQIGTDFSQSGTVQDVADFGDTYGLWA